MLSKYVVSLVVILYLLSLCLNRVSTVYPCLVCIVHIWRAHYVLDTDWLTKVKKRSKLRKCSRQLNTFKDRHYCCRQFNVDLKRRTTPTLSTVDHNCHSFSTLKGSNSFWVMICIHSEQPFFGLESSWIYPRQFKLRSQREKE